MSAFFRQWDTRGLPGVEYSWPGLKLLVNALGSLAFFAGFAGLTVVYGTSAFGWWCLLVCAVLLAATSVVRVALRRLRQEQQRIRVAAFEDFAASNDLLYSSLDAGLGADFYAQAGAEALSPLRHVFVSNGATPFFVGCRPARNSKGHDIEGLWWNVVAVAMPAAPPPMTLVRTLRRFAYALGERVLLNTEADDVMAVYAPSAMHKEVLQVLTPDVVEALVESSFGVAYVSQGWLMFVMEEEMTVDREEFWLGSLASLDVAIAELVDQVARFGRMGRVPDWAKGLVAGQLNVDAAGDGGEHE